MSTITKAILVLLIIAVVTRILNAEFIRITTLARGFTQMDLTSAISDLQCYPSAPDQDASLQFGKAATIPNDSNPPTSTQHSNSFPYVRVIDFPKSNADWFTDGVGPFFCEATKSGREASRVTSFFQRSNAKFAPSNGRFTTTVNVGDVGVEIVMTAVHVPDAADNVISWRKNGGTRVDGELTYPFPNPIQSSDGAIYEIHYNHERSSARSSMHRLIVRECAAGRWGPPGCHGICDKCYNGGVCDDKTGTCICPNNFKGQNCLEICHENGGNRFGVDCEFKCTYRTGTNANACRTYLFCLPDPFGCSCDAGAKGLNCSTSCDAGEYGAGCMGTCHCNTGSCSRFTGKCTDANDNSCAASWSGDNCQIPDVCDVGYYGSECTAKCHCLDNVACDKQTGACPEKLCAAGYLTYAGLDNCQECDGAFFGVNCTEACHCIEGSCDKVTGACSGSCLTNWLDPDCQTGISRLTYVRVNPNQPTTFSCFVEGDPIPAEDEVNLYWVDGQQSRNTGISKNSSLLFSSEREVLFDVDNPYSRDYFCFLPGTPNNNTASLRISTEPFVLPVLAQAPVMTSVTATSITIQWQAWGANEDDVGDPPLAGYAIFQGDQTTSWVEAGRVGEDVTVFTVMELEADSDYELSVSAIREGLGGTGPRSPSTRIVTACSKPTASPTQVTVLAVNAKELELSWEAPDSQTAVCRSGFTHFVIHYSSSAKQASLEIPFNTTSYTLTGLDTYVQYTIQITAANKDEESDAGEGVTMTTIEERAPAPVGVTLQGSTGSSFTVSWAVPSPVSINGNIMRYELQYHQTSPTVGTEKLISVPSTQVEYTERDLQSAANYSIQICTVNGLGEGNWSEPIIVRTAEAAAGTGALVGGVVGALLVIALVLVVVVVLLQRRRKRDPKSAGIYDDLVDGKAGRDQPTVIYSNSEVNIDEENAYEGVDFEKPPIAERTSSKSPAQSKHYSNGKPVAVVLPEPVTNDEKPRPPAIPAPFAEYIKDKSASRLSVDHLASRGSSTTALNKSPSIEGGLSRSCSGSQDNLEEVGQRMGAGVEDDGDIYQNVTLPGPVMAKDLHTYIQTKKKSGDSNELIHEFNLLKNDPLHPWEVASNEKNKAKNRFRNIIAYDHSRVVLDVVNGDPYSDYYNANYINNYKGERAFIAAQAPNTASLTAFWRMIWQENVETVVMVTNLIESGKDRCRQYWPKHTRTVETIGEFSLYLVKTESFSDHVVRTLFVQKTGSEEEDEGDEEQEKRTVTQFHYLSWPDMGVPQHYTTLIALAESVKRHHVAKQQGGAKGPMLVHCSAGVGRTGTFICLYNMLDTMRETGVVDIFGFTTKMRQNRIRMVQTHDQYVFLYNALLEVYMSGETETPVSKFREKLGTLHRSNSRTHQSNIEVEFENLHTLTPVPAANGFKGGQDPKNKNKNRFPDILPLEKNRPYLAHTGISGCTDYINASFMNTFRKKDVFIATQTPLPHTAVDMWRLVFDWKCPIIVMLNELDASDKTCAQYWPSEGSTTIGPLEVTLTDTRSSDSFVHRSFSVEGKENECVGVEQFQLLGWSASHNKPDSPLALLQLVDTVRNAVKAAESTGPVIVHCINGIGRSGVFCALWSVMEKIEHDHTVDIFHAVKRLRSNRPNMVESLDQYQLCYEVIDQHLQRFDEYANVDVL